MKRKHIWGTLLIFALLVSTPALGAPVKAASQAPNKISLQAQVPDKIIYPQEVMILQESASELETEGTNSFLRESSQSQPDESISSEGTKAGNPSEGTSREQLPPETPESEAETEEAFVHPLTFHIDDTHRYQGMERSYQAGYLPTVENGKAILILPLLTEGDVLGKTLTVTPSLGNTERSPFVYRNYQQTIAESSELPLDGGPAVTLYLVRLELELDRNRYNGVYPVGLSITARDDEGMTVTQNFTTYVTITDGKSTEAGNSLPEQTKPESQPFLYVESYQVTPEPVVAGEAFTVTAKICNTSEKRDVQNLAFTVSSGTDQLTLLEDSNTIFWEELEAGESRELRIRYQADPQISVGKYHINLSMTYDNEDAMTLSSSGDLTVTVTQPMRVEGEYPAFTSGANAGDTISLDFQAVNMGRSAAYNVRFELDAAGLIPSGSAYVGNLEGGTSGSAQMKVFVGAKSMNRELEEGEDPYGYTSGTMTMIYEDENGQEYRVEEYFSTTIHELVIGTGENEAEPESESNLQWWLAVIGGAGVLLAAGGIAVYRRLKQNREK